MISMTFILGVLLAYIALLYLCAFITEKWARSGTNLANNPLVYSLSLAVYCTSWTYYGSIEMAAKFGFLFMAVYIGATLSLIGAAPLLHRLVRMKRRYHITNIADLISVRYGRSELLGAMATMGAVVGLIPYIALQLKSILATSTLIAVTSNTQADQLLSKSLGPIFVGTLIAGTVLLGIRRLDPTERHPGLIITVAVENVVKLVAFLAAGGVIVFLLGGGLGATLHSAGEKFGTQIQYLGRTTTPELLKWLTYILLSGSAVLFLPRQFHVTVVENSDERHLKTASWLFPSYLVLINLFVLPVAVTGLLAQVPVSRADTYLLELPLKSGHPYLAVLIFLGGFSAAAGMVIVETMALSTMITHHLMMPLINRFRVLAFAKRHMLQMRWVAAGFVIVAGYHYTFTVGNSYALVSMGMISFAAVLQFAPATVGGLFWRKGNKAGAALGLTAGFAAWAYMLFIPAFIKGGHVESALLERGPFGLQLLRPESFLGLSGLDPLTHAAFWTLFFNVGFYMLGSLVFRTSAAEQLDADNIVGAQQGAALTASHSKELTIDRATKEQIVYRTFEQFLPPAKARELTDRAMALAGISSAPQLSALELVRLQDQAELVLAGSIGMAAAHVALRNAEFITSPEQKALSHAYGEMLAEIRLSPEEIRKKIDFFAERKEIFARQAADLQARLNQRDEENLIKTVELLNMNQQLKESLAALREAQERLLETSKFTALGEMAGGVAHEINTPLCAIQLIAEQLQTLLSDEKLDREMVAKLLGKIVELTGRIAAIIKGLRMFSRNAGMDPLQKESVAGILRSTLSFCEHKFKSEGIEVAVKYPDESIALDCRPTQISQVVLNLLNNARDAIMTLPERWIRVDVESGVDHVEVSVTDSGPGIDAMLRAKIFQPFFTTKPVGLGTGLGLSVSKGIIESHQGSLNLDTACGNTRFIIRLPRCGK